MLLSIEIEKVNSVMTSKTEILPTLEERILDVENHFGRLQREIEEIGLPAGLDLQRRLEELKIEEQASPKASSLESISQFSTYVCIIDSPSLSHFNRKTKTSRRLLQDNGKRLKT
jgi:hypothetical protein